MNLFSRIIVFILILLVIPFTAGYSQGPKCGCMAGNDKLTTPYLTTFNTELFSGSGNCALCHDFITDQDKNDISIASDWSSSMMANAVRDPLWQAKVDSEMLRNPNLKDIINEKCLACHGPMANIEGAKSRAVPDIFGDKGILEKNTIMGLVAEDGVSCTFCHQIKDNAGYVESSFSGNFKIDMDSIRPLRSIYGQYPDPLVTPMKHHIGYTPVHSDHIGKSELCATCHTLYTPVFSDNREITGKFPEQTTYLEWSHSSFGDSKDDNDVSCRECHMPYASGKVKISNRPPFVSQREPFSKHYFVGGNILILSILRDFRESMGITLPVSKFDKTINRTVKQLKQNTGDISIENIVSNNDMLEITVRVRNRAGHKFPTGFPSRRAWIHFMVTDTDGRTVFESGKPDINGDIAGDTTNSASGLYESHYEIIDRSDMVQIYESLMRGKDGKVTFTLMNAVGYLKDTRLLPSGFDKQNAGKDIAVNGAAVEDKNFTEGSDDIKYAINITGFKGPFSISARLLYSSVSYPFISDLESDREKSKAVERFMEYYEKADKKPVEISRADKSY